MFIVYYSKVSEEKGIAIMGQSYNKDNVNHNISHIIVEQIPGTTEMPGKNSVLCVDLLAEELYYEYVDRPLTREEELEQEIRELRARLEATNN